MTPELLAKLKIAREKAQRVKRKLAAGGVEAKMKHLQDKMNKMSIKAKAKSPPIDEVEEREEEREEEEEEEVIIKREIVKKKKKKKPVIVIEQISSEEEEEEPKVIYVPRRKRREPSPEPEDKPVVTPFHQPLIFQRPPNPFFATRLFR